jgi:hypothetical protein
MDLSILQPQELSKLVEQVETSEQTNLNTGADLGPSVEEATRSSDNSVRRPGSTTAEADIVSAAPEEFFVADARGGLTPGQMVEQKVLALMGGNYPGLASQASGRRGNSRRNFGT